MTKRYSPPPRMRCKDCELAVPVTWEHLTPDHKPIFCTCKHWRYYRMIDVDRCVLPDRLEKLFK